MKGIVKVMEAIDATSGCRCNCISNLRNELAATSVMDFPVEVFPTKWREE